MVRSFCEGVKNTGTTITYVTEADNQYGNGEVKKKAPVFYTRWGLGRGVVSHQQLFHSRFCFLDSRIVFLDADHNDAAAVRSDLSDG